MEELERDAASLENLIERRKHHIAHARSHLPEEVASIGEQQAKRSAERLAGGQARPSKVAVFVGEPER